MSKIEKKSGSLFLAEYTGIIEEVELNWGFRDGYFEKEKLPVLFIFSNFPNTIKTNRQSLLGSIRTHVEEQKGIIFFPDAFKKDVNQIVNEALKKEKVDQVFHSYSGEKYNPDYLAQICDTCFSIKNIKLKEVTNMLAPKNEQSKSIHQEIIKKIGEIEDKEVTCFILDKEEKEIVDSLHLESEFKTATKKKITFDELIKDKAFKTRFFDLFSGENSAPDRIKRFYEGKNWKFHSLLILYSSRHKRVFIQDLPKSAIFLNASDTTFMGLNTGYSLISFNYEEKSDQKITMTKNSITDKFDIFVDDKPAERSDIKSDIMNTFHGCTASVNQFLHMLTNTQSNEYRFFYDKMAVVVKMFGNKYLIESYEAK